MFKRIGVISAILLFAGMIASAYAGLDGFKDEAGSVRIAGGTAHIPVMKEMAEKIMATNPKITVTVAGGGSGAGIKQVSEGIVEIGNSGREPKPEEVSTGGLKVFKWAIDGVAVAVHPENTVKALTSAQVKDIFSGKITNWKDLGGKDCAINVYTRDVESGTREVFWEKALSKGEITDKAVFVKSNGAMKTSVAGDPCSIGYVSAGHIDSTVKAVSVDGTEPSKDNILSGKYSIARGLYSSTKGEPKGLVKKFIDYLFTAEGKALITEKGFIPVQ